MKNYLEKKMDRSLSARNLRKSSIQDLEHSAFDASNPWESNYRLLQEQERSNSGRLVELPNNPSLSPLNTFMDDNLQDLMAMLDAKEVEKKDEKQNGER